MAIVYGTHMMVLLEIAPIYAPLYQEPKKYGFIEAFKSSLKYPSQVQIERSQEIFLCLLSSNGLQRWSSKSRAIHHIKITGK